MAILNGLPFFISDHSSPIFLFTHSGQFPRGESIPHTLMRWPCHQEKIAILQKDIALVKTIIVTAFASGFVDVGEVGKVKSPMAKLAAIDFSLSGVVEVLQDAAVPAKHVDDRTHVMGFGTVDAIVIVGTAVVVAKFFIGSSLNERATFLTEFVNMI